MKGRRNELKLITLKQGRHVGLRHAMIQRRILRELSCGKEKNGLEARRRTCETRNSTTADDGRSNLARGANGMMRGRQVVFVTDRVVALVFLTDIE
jgi:hypothetical protein